uniref:Uncharacterized protein n=1 Tax=Anguilla anguilla TaxID=7936 RepID=A0A0E9QZB2_ANGAN
MLFWVSYSPLCLRGGSLFTGNRPSTSASHPSNFCASNCSFSMVWLISASRGSTLLGSPICGFFT